MSKINVILMLVGSVLLSSCGGGGGGESSSGSTGGTSGTLPAERPSGNVAGTVFLDAVSNSTISVYSYADGVKGGILGAGITDSNGGYSIDFKSADTPILIEASGGQYVEESSGVTVSLSAFKLRAISQYTSGLSHNVHITHFTNLAAGYAKYLVDSGISISNAINTSNNKFTALLGFNIVTTKPLSVVSSANASAAINNGLRYGFAHAGISKFMENVSARNSAPAHTIYNSIMYSEESYNDILDGVSDGYVGGTQIFFGSEALVVNNYRYDLAIAILSIADSASNVTNVSAVDLNILARAINDSTDEVYGAAPTVDLNSSKPIIDSVNIADNSILFGNTPFFVSASDETGISSITANIGGLAEFSLENAKAALFDTVSGSTPDNLYIITFTVVNNLGISTSVSRNVSIINSLNTVSGRVMSAPVLFANVDIYDYSGFVKGDKIGSDITDNKGDYSVAVRSFSKPFLIEVTNGSYVESVTNVNVALKTGESITAVTNFVAGVDIDVAVTPYTTFAHARASYLSGLGVDDVTAISTANSQFNDILGFDLISTQSLDVANISSASITLTDAHKSGFLIASISQWTNDLAISLGITPHSLITTYSFIDMGRADILADGLLDGFGAGGAQLSLSTKNVNAFVYTHELSLSAMDFIRGSRNLTVLNNEVLYPYIVTYNGSLSPLFDGVSVVSLNEGAPSYVGNVFPEATDLYKGTPVTEHVKGFITPRLDVYTTVGIKSAELYIDGSLVSSAATFPSRTGTLTFSPVNTNIGDGQHTYNWVITDIMGGSFSQTQLVNYKNSKTIFSYTNLSGRLNDYGVYRYSQSSQPVVGGVCEVFFSVNNTVLSGDKLNVKSNGVDIDYFGVVSNLNAGKGESWTFNGVTYTDTRYLYRLLIPARASGCVPVTPIAGSDLADNSLTTIPYLDAVESNNFGFIEFTGGYCRLNTVCP